MRLSAMFDLLSHDRLLEELLTHRPLPGPLGRVVAPRLASSRSGQLTRAPEAPETLTRLRALPPAQPRSYFRTSVGIAARKRRRRPSDRSPAPPPEEP